MKKNYLKMFKIFLTLLISSLFSFGCGKAKNNNDGKTEIVFWHSFVSSTVPALNSLIDKFESENPSIKINAQYVPTGDALVQKLITAIQSKTAPDIAWIHSDFINKLVDADAIYKMEHFIKGTDSLSKKK
jgi:ABC-type glycerol-3-phosphate transport system substrate-binding protein